MRKYVSLSPLPFTFLLVACHPSLKVGGPCSYIDLAENAQVTEIQQSLVLLANEHNQYEVELDLFTSPPRMGDSYKVSFSQITQGACTPMNINAVELVREQ